MDVLAITVTLTTDSIKNVLISAAAVFALIQGLKNLFPSLFPPGSKIAIILAAIGALVTGLIPCFTGGFDVGCAIQAVSTFLIAIGVYHSVSQAGGAVHPALPPAFPPGAPNAPPKP